MRWRTKVVLGAGLLIATIGLGNPPARAQAAECYAETNGRLMFMFNGTLISCARTIAAAKTGEMGRGTWGGQLVQVDSEANVWVNGQYVGVAKNVSGTVGSLSDRCSRGDQQACAQWQKQLEEANRRMEQMYPPGWAE